MPKTFLAGLCVVWSGLSYAAEPEPVRVYAAASLTPALNELIQTYQKTHNVSVQPSYASSSTLAKQIDAGAPAEVIAFADESWMDYLQTHQRINPKSRLDWLGNELVLVSPVDRPVRLAMSPTTKLATAFTGKLCTADTASVPLGRYAKQSLEALGWWPSVQSRVVGADDARAALNWIEHGDCGLGVIYATDARQNSKVQVVGQFPSSTHSPIRYPLALSATVSPAAREFYQYLQSPSAKAVFQRYGFQTLSSSSAPR